MNAQTILTRIERDAREAGAATLREARARAEALEQVSEARVEAARSAAIEQARRDAIELDDRMLRMAKLDSRKALLAAKREVLDQAFAEALARMQAMPADAARAFGMRLLLDAAKGGETLIADENSAWCDAAFVAEANTKLPGGGVTLSKETRALGGGFLLLRGGMEINCSFPAALDVERMRLEAEVAELLFT